LPVTVAFLSLALAALAFRAGTRHGYGPFVLGLIGSLFVVLGKFEWQSNPALYGAIGLLIAASLWNAWPIRQIENVTYSGCERVEHENT
jgi:hypothetical protein